jgi:hypothetical protein
MTTRAGPLYELTFSVDPAVATEFERWLLELSEQASHKQGIADTRVFEVRDDGADVLTWTCQFQCLDDIAFDELRDSFFANTDAAVTQEFGTAVGVSSRVLREDNPQELATIENPDCLNCGTRLKGQYCGVCGQRARNRLISLWELVSDAFGDLLEIDSRVWRTLIPLLVRPGHLTRDYLEGRRVRYMPPFRTYLVLSVIFFLVAFFDPHDDLGLLFEPEPEPTPEELTQKATQAEEAKREILDELAAEGIIRPDTATDDPAKEVNERKEEDAEESSTGFNIQIDDGTGDCNVNGGELSELPEWFKRRFTPERLKTVCERVTADGGKTFVDLLLDNIPVALIVLLPLMALVLKVLYPLSRRYFVEHLLFFVHYHAFFFLILTLQILFARLAALIHLPEAIAVLTIVAASFYIPVYLYLAMRRVYGQGRILTFIKYIGLLIAYSLGAMLTMLSAVLFALVAV